jgi:hypothetical protein
VYHIGQRARSYVNSKKINNERMQISTNKKYEALKK